jgi:hypothetical protein
MDSPRFTFRSNKTIPKLLPKTKPLKNKSHQEQVQQEQQIKPDDSIDNCSSSDSLSVSANICSSTRISDSCDDDTGFVDKFGTLDINDDEEAIVKSKKAKKADPLCKSINEICGGDENWSLFPSTKGGYKVIKKDLNEKRSFLVKIN